MGRDAAEQQTIAGMGHDLPAGALARLTDLIADHVAASKRAGTTNEGVAA